MCRNIRPLFNYDPPATSEEIHLAALQFVRNISGYNKPSKVNTEPFNEAISAVETVIENLLSSLVTRAKPKDREIELQKRRELNKKRFGSTNK